tara:strand:- start:74 stop:322 length:249 start_codon:yes stop_codon:yes gene_type:complete
MPVTKQSTKDTKVTNERTQQGKALFASDYLALANQAVADGNMALAELRTNQAIGAGMDTLTFHLRTMLNDGVKVRLPQGWSG